uniref:Glutathione S-transferase kappa 1 n=1 Tax=Panagrolaimus superbus TaxID=310955 RepID=A0A914Y5V3_9BILA
MKSSGNRPPILLPAKAQYMPNDLRMLSKYWGFNLSLNPNFATEIIPNGTILPQRFLTALEQNAPKYLIPAAREFWKRIWETHQSIHEEEHLKEVAKSIGLENVEKYIEMTKSAKIRDILKQRTTEAVETGAFGAPWFVIRKEGEQNRCFWGSDRLPVVLNECGVDFVGAMKSKM